jgi:hypothetical protein
MRARVKYSFLSGVKDVQQRLSDLVGIVSSSRVSLVPPLKKCPRRNYVEVQWSIVGLMSPAFLGEDLGALGLGRGGGHFAQGSPRP